MRRKAFISCAVIFTVALVLTLLARLAGGWLIVEDPPQHSRAIVVLGGHLPFRALEAAAIYQQGWATEVWLTQGRRSAEEVSLEHLEVRGPSEADYSRQVLEKRGVPREAIHILPERNRDTADEVRHVAKRLQESGGGKVIFVTSKFHTRRLKLLWRVLEPTAAEALVRYTPDDLFDPDHWWRTSGDSMAVLREYAGMLNALAGFPVSADR